MGTTFREITGQEMIRRTGIEYRYEDRENEGICSLRSDELHVRREQKAHFFVED